MTQTISAAEVRKAGGLEKWKARASQSTPVKLPAKVPAALGRMPSDAMAGYAADRMNNLEARYAGRLEAMRRAGQIAYWEYEAIALRLADRTTYTPDFFVVMPDGQVGFHETKGYWREDAMIKFKLAVEQFPMFFFESAQLDKAGEWVIKQFGYGVKHG